MKMKPYIQLQSIQLIKNGAALVEFCLWGLRISPAWLSPHPYLIPCSFSLVPEAHVVIRKIA